MMNRFFALTALVAATFIGSCVGQAPVRTCCACGFPSRRALECSSDKQFVVTYDSIAEETREGHNGAWKSFG